MAKAVRAIIIEDSKMLVMHRNKYGSQYFTLVGGRIGEHESVDQALIREVKEETGLDVTQARLVYTEDHPEPYNDQYIYLCEIAPHGDVAIQDYSEEAFLNRMDLNVHKPVWIETRAFERLPFRTPQLHEAMLKALKKGFPNEPVKLS